MENEAKPKSKAKHPDRVTLSPESLARLAQWIGETQNQFKGTRITKTDLVDFLILSHSAHLSERELEQLQIQHFDEVRFAAWALGQLKEARAQGKTISLSDIISAAPQTKKRGDADDSTTVKSK